jgi:catechol 2,3-dioxygenase-like lactoylglutathione lyase family enzyme
VDQTEFDHAVIQVDDWDAANEFYARVLGAELVENPEGQANPLGAWASRFGGQQLNVHGPWPGLSNPCCPPPLNRVGANGVTIESGPIRRFGSRGWGTSVYCRDPSGNSIELIAYDTP